MEDFRNVPMRKIFITMLLLQVMLLVACQLSEEQLHEPEFIIVYASTSTRPLLNDFYACAPTETIIKISDNPAAADIYLGLGEPALSSSYAYQIASEEIQIVTHNQSQLQDLSLLEARGLFLGKGNPSLQIWVYAPGEDIQKIFEMVLMNGQSVSSLAHLAMNPQHMLAMIKNDSNSIGILPGHFVTADIRVIFSIPEIPVLVNASENPQGVIQGLISCLQQ